MRGQFPCFALLLLIATVSQAQNTTRVVDEVNAGRNEGGSGDRLLFVSGPSRIAVLQTPP